MVGGGGGGGMKMFHLNQKIVTTCHLRYLVSDFVNVKEAVLVFIFHKPDIQSSSNFNANINFQTLSTLDVNLSNLQNKQ